jgi:hypothetical protein
MSEERFCTTCDGPITTRDVDDIPRSVCMNCSRIEGGYSPGEKDIMEMLRGIFRFEDTKWMISSALLSVRKLLKDRTQASPPPSNVAKDDVPVSKCCGAGRNQCSPEECEDCMWRTGDECVKEEPCEK